MTTFLLTGVVLFGSFIANVLLLQGLADTISLRLWQTVPQPELRRAAAEIDHVIAAIITAAVFGLLWRDHPVLAVFVSLGFYLLLLAGGTICLLLLTRKHMNLIEDRQFSLENGQLVLPESVQLSPPVFCCLDERRFSATEGLYPEMSSGALSLYSPETGFLARNIYYDRLQASRTLDQLKKDGHVRTFDLALLGKESEDSCLSLRLGHHWVPLLCSPLVELPPQVRDWWKQLLDSEYHQPVRIQDHGFSHYLHPLQLAAESAGLYHDRFIDEFHGLEQLVKQASQPLQ